MADLYAFCRLVDDIADQDDGDIESRWKNIKAISEWIKGHKVINHSYWDRFNREREEFRIPDDVLQGIVDGVCWDLINLKLEIQTWDALNQYVHGVACCVGEAVLYILGAHGPKARPYARYMGRCLQYLNIMRDLKEDEANLRIYVPKEFLKTVRSMDRDQVVRDELYKRAMQYRARAIPYSWKCLAAEMMASFYIEASNKWWLHGEPHRLNRKEKLWIALKTLAKFIFYPSSLFKRPTIASTSRPK